MVPLVLAGGVVAGAVVSIAFMLAGLLLSSGYHQDRQKKSPYECGFDPVGSGREPFSLRFFLVAILFLIFEAEAALFWPVVGVFWTGCGLAASMWGVIALYGLLLGLMWEWWMGCLEWA